MNHRDHLDVSDSDNLDVTTDSESDERGRWTTDAAATTGVDRGLPTAQRVVRAVSSRLGVDSLDLPPLYDAVDPDALDALFSDPPGMSWSRTGTVSFEYATCTVFVHGDGTIVVEDAE
jgi:hypothetical protein